MDNDQHPSAMSLFNKWKPVVTLAVVIQLSIGSGIWGGAWYIANIKYDMEYNQQVLREKIEMIEKTAGEDRYTLTAASEKALRTAIENPGMRVPDPRDPSKIIMVKKSALVDD